MGERSVQKKQLILEKAKEVFVEKGFRNVTMKDIGVMFQGRKEGIALVGKVSGFPGAVGIDAVDDTGQAEEKDEEIEEGKQWDDIPLAGVIPPELRKAG